MAEESFVCSVCAGGLPAERVSGVCSDCEYKAEKRAAAWMAVITAAMIIGLLAVFLVNSRQW